MTLPVLRPTPGSVTRSSSSVGTSPSNRSSSALAMPMMLFVFCRKNPVAWMSSSTSAGSACARSAGVGYLANSAGVTWFTISSVVCAERIVAVSSWNGESWIERAQRLGVARILAREPLDHDRRPLLRAPRPGHAPRLPGPVTATPAVPWRNALDPGAATARARGRRRSSRRLEAAAAAHDGHESLGSFIERDLDCARRPRVDRDPRDRGRRARRLRATSRRATRLADPHLVAALVVDPDAPSRRRRRRRAPRRARRREAAAAGASGSCSG